MSAIESTPAWEIEGLPAGGPDPALREPLMLFGQFVGDWEILECRNLQDDGSWESGRGAIHWRWILEGRAVQDTWMGYDEEAQRMVPGGTTVRFYDPALDAWHSVWISPLQGAVRRFFGRSIGDEIVLESKDSTIGGGPERWIFSEITPTSFRWRGERLREKSGTWELTEEMRVRRSPPTQ